MRKCIRCGAEMQEGCTIKVEGAGYGVVLSTEENKIFGGRVGKPRVAICPECGKAYVSGGTTRTTTKANPRRSLSRLKMSQSPALRR